MDEVTDVEGATVVEEEPIIDLPKTIPCTIQDIQELHDKITALIERPRGAGMLLRAVNQYLHHKPLLEQSIKTINKSLAFVHGERARGTSPTQKQKKVALKAKKFYDSLSEPAIRTHCQMYGLSYDNYETVDARIAALVERSTQVL